MLVERTYRRQKRVVLAERKDLAARITNLETVLEDLAPILEQHVEQSVRVTNHRIAPAVVGNQRYRLGVRAEGAHHHAAIGHMGAENRMRIRMAQREQARDFIPCDAQNLAI